MDQIERISHYEDILNRLASACADLEAALDAFVSVQPQAKELGEYYGGPDWRKDLGDDEAGHLPAGLRRGVLSEDAAYNALTDNDRLLQRLAEIAEELCKDSCGK